MLTKLCLKYFHHTDTNIQMTILNIKSLFKPFKNMYSISTKATVLSKIQQIQYTQIKNR